MPHAASGRLQHDEKFCQIMLQSFNAARGKWSVATHHVGSPMILDLTGTIWREMQNYSIFSILEHVHKSEI